ncbi:hydrolase-like protein [Novymonas esmeraldas]|uniref:Hydrolase-like protein n=1 Tax=Novymonas esmeraldas TaxID=1808958 RepID=A0AAW0EQA1_9TRYP
MASCDGGPTKRTLPQPCGTPTLSAHPEDMDLPADVVAALRRTFPPAPEDICVPVGRCASTGKEITLCYSAFGSPDDPCILLIMGMNTTSMMWDSRFCGYLAAAGFYVVRYDHRDTGRSVHLDGYPSPMILRLALPAWASVGEAPLAYTLEDLAEDAAGLLRALKIRQAHLVGCSMGGMLAQLLVLRHPEMVASLSLLSTSAGVALPRPSMLLSILDQPASLRDVHSVLDYRVRFFKAVAGDMSFHEDEFRLGMWYDVARSHHLGSGRRHLAAVARSGDRSAALRAFFSEKRGASGRLPVVVLHGAKDPLIPLSNGQHLASCIEGSRLVVFPRMGHYFSADMHRSIAEEIILNARAASAASA